MIDIYSSEVEHWTRVYGVIFSILILSLAINLTAFIKNKINRLLSILISTPFFYWIFNNKVFGHIRTDAEQQEPLAVFMISGFDKNIFNGFSTVALSLIAAIILIIRLIIQHRKSKFK